jgi:predicted aspartyl protease
MLAPVTYVFNGHQGLVIVYATLVGPKRETRARLAVDTGAVYTVIRPSALRNIGYLTSSYPTEYTLANSKRRRDGFAD